MSNTFTITVWSPKEINYPQILMAYHMDHLEALHLLYLIKNPGFKLNTKDLKINSY